MRFDALRLGSRGSKLALAQAQEVKELLQRAHQDLRVDIITIKTTGDRDQASSLSNMSSVGVFTKSIESALLAGEIDIAVHSAKDLPSQITDGLSIGAVPKRAACNDVLISRDGRPLEELPEGATIGTGSPRRRALVLHRHPDLQVNEIRGNLHTRLGKLDSGEYDALLLAEAGLSRLGLADRITEALPLDQFLPAPGQGFLAIQARAEDNFIIEVLREIDDRDAHRCLDAERLLMANLGAGCSAAVGARARIENEILLIDAVVLDIEGRSKITASAKTAADGSIEALIEGIASGLREQGAMELIAANE